MNRNLPNIAHLDKETKKDFSEFLSEYEKEITWVQTHNKTSAPYHNTAHLIGVAFLIYSATQFEKGKFHGLFREIITAGLLHDFCYPRSHDDEFNITCTLEFIKPFFDEFHKSDRAAVQDFIGMTYFSFEGLPSTNYDRSDLTRRSLIEMRPLIREADTLYGTVFFDKSVFEGLYTEIGCRFHQSRSEFITRNIEFVENTAFTVPIYQALYNQTIERCIQEHKAM